MKNFKWMKRFVSKISIRDSKKCIEKLILESLRENKKKKTKQQQQQ